MSLVREALEKAEREAAARAAREKGLPESLSGSAGPYRAPRRAAGPWGTLAVVGLTTLALAMSAWFLTRSFRRPQTMPRPAAEAAAPDPATATVEPTSATGAPAIAEPTIEAPPPARADSMPTPAAAPTPAPVPEPSRAAATVAATPSTGTVLRRAVLENGRTLELGGIAWSETTPLAYLNGRLRGVGEVVEGFRVDAIEPEAVELSGDAGRRLRITLR